jgi:hypothetical protein
MWHAGMFPANLTFLNLYIRLQSSEKNGESNKEHINKAVATFMFSSSYTTYSLLLTLFNDI